MAKLRNTEVKIMVLLLVHRPQSVSSCYLAIVDHTTPRRLHTYAHTRHICASLIQKRYHMPPLSYRAFETGIERIAGKEGEEVRLVFEAGIRPVVVDDGLETRDATDWLCGSGPEKVSFVPLVVHQHPGAYSTW